jgi:hypothetical protein
MEGANDIDAAQVPQTADLHSYSPPQQRPVHESCGEMTVGGLGRNLTAGLCFVPGEYDE